MATQTKISVSLEAIETGTADLGTPRLVHALTNVLDMVTGTGSSQSDLVWSDTRSLAATSESIDLAVTLTSQLTGAVVTFAKVKAILIRNNTATTLHKLIVGGAAANQFINWVGDATDKIHVGPSGVFLLTSPVDGFAVTAATGDILKIDSGALTISYTIVIIGTSA